MVLQQLEDSREKASGLKVIELNLQCVSNHHGPPLYCKQRFQECFSCFSKMISWMAAGAASPPDSRGPSREAFSQQWFLYYLAARVRLELTFEGSFLFSAFPRFIFFKCLQLPQCSDRRVAGRRESAACSGLQKHWRVSWKNSFHCLW